MFHSASHTHLAEDLSKGKDMENLDFGELDNLVSDDEPEPRANDSAVTD